MPSRIPDDKRAAILADIQAGELGNREIARKHGVAASTVTRCAADAGIDDAFERSQTKKATAAQSDGQARRRSEAALKLHDLGLRALNLLSDKLDDLSPTQLVTVMGVAFDKHVALTKVAETDEQERREAAQRHAQQLTAALRLAVTQMGLTAQQEALLGPALRDAVTALTGEEI